MSPPAIAISGLRKTFGRGRRAIDALRGIDLMVEPGQVYGFLGPNGAGKSTTIRMIADLVRPTAGRIELFGEDVRGNREALRRVGVLVEGALFYPHLSGRANLEVLGRTMGRFGAREVQELLVRVDLSEHGHRPVAAYSMGMKQRLGVAAALLGRPELVILDEPTIVRHGRVAELLDRQERLRLEVSPVTEAATVLRQKWDVQRVEDVLFVDLRGTWKNLTPRQSRGRLVLVKFAVMSVLVVLTFGVLSVVMVAGGLLRCVLAGVPVGPALDQPHLTSAVADYLLNASLAFLSFLITGVFAAVGAIYSRAILGGTLCGIVMVFIDPAMLYGSRLVSQLLDAPWILHLQRLSPYYNIENTRSWLSLEQHSEILDASFSVMDLARPGDVVAFSLVVLLVWVVGGVTATMAVFERQDITS